MRMEESRCEMVEYKFLKQNTQQNVPKRRWSLIMILAIFQVFFICLIAVKGKYDSVRASTISSPLYSMFMDVHSMMFVGFGFLMTFLKRYGYSSLSFNFLVAAFVLEWALIVRGLIGENFSFSNFEINLTSLLVSDFCAAAVLISFGAVLGKTSLTQLIIMATFEVVLQSINEHIGLHFLKAVDVGESIYVHVFGAYFGLAVAKMLHHKEIESEKESSHYHSDLFSMVGTLFLWLYWPSFNSAVAVDEGQTRAVVNTFLSIAASTITTFLFSMLTNRKRLDMVHIQNATLAGGVAVGAVADMMIQPYGALLIGSVAGMISVLGFAYISPLLKSLYLHDTCGVNNLHGLPGVFSGLMSAVVAAYSTPDLYGGEENLKKFYPLVVNGTDGFEKRSPITQASYQLAALGVTLLVAIIGGVFTGLFMRLPIFEQVNDEEDMFDDEKAFLTPDDYSLKLTEVRHHLDETEMTLGKSFTTSPV